MNATTIGGWLALWLSLALFEVALIGKLDAQETPIGCAVALVATFATALALAAARRHYGFRLTWAWLALLVARNVVRDTFLVYAAVVRGLAGGPARDAYVEIPFEPGGADPQSMARRALVIASVSTSPNEIVLALDRERRIMRVHVLAETGSQKYSREWPL